VASKLSTYASELRQAIISMSNTGFQSPAKQALIQQLLERGWGEQSLESAIPKRDPARSVPLSFAQEQAWLHIQLAPGLPVYNEPFTIRRHGPLDPAVLVRCFEEIVRRHEAWRTSFIQEDGRVVQRVHAAPSLSFPLLDLRHLPSAQREREALRLAADDARQTFDLSCVPLFRGTVVRTADEEYRIFLTVHQLIIDGTANVLLPELATLYQAFANNRPSPLPELPIQYGDFAAWERQGDSEAPISASLEYWRKQLAGDLPNLELPTRRARPPVQTFRGEMQSFLIPAILVKRVQELAQEESATTFMALVAILATLFHRYTGQTDIVLGSLSANRKRRETEALLGYFVNPVVLRVDVSGDPSFREVLRRVRDTVLSALSHDQVPFTRLVQALQIKPDPSRNPLFQLMISLEPPLAHDCPGWSASQSDVSNGACKLDLYFDLDESDQGIVGPVLYNPDLFESDAVARMLEHVRILTDGATAQSGAPVSRLPLLTTEEKVRLEAFNQTASVYPRLCVHRLFEAQADRTPDRIAVVAEGESLSYRDLNERANRLAAYLRTLGVQREMLVAIAMDRSPYLVVALFAVLKAGGAYVPIDTANPKERINSILADARPAIVLTTTAVRSELPETAARLIAVDREWPTIATHSAENSASDGGLDALAYVIYTSGSTGKPKGVQLEHRSVTNFLCSMQREPGITPDDILLAITTIGFDIAGLEIFLPLISGARVHVASRAAGQDAYRLQDVLRQSHATIMQATPATWRMLVESGWPGDSQLKAFCGGEALAGDLARELVTRSASAWNLYGPTETTIWSALTRLGGELATVCIGRPIANTQLYVLDGNLQPVPIGVTGELYIGGDGLARGYLHHAELTAEKFVCDTFTGVPHRRLYRTGDLVRRLTDGEIEFLGRADYQVKIRGFRVELGEIEAALRQHPAVHDVVVAHRTDIAAPQLTAYVIPKYQHLTGPDLRIFLADQLPEYMQPSRFVFLQSFPLNPSGKVDRRALPSPQPINPPTGSQLLPRTALEKQIAGIWADVLARDQIGMHDNFFDLGGHSLLVVQVQARIKTLLEYHLSVVDIFRYPTVAMLAERLAAGDAEPDRPPPASVSDKRHRNLSRRLQARMQARD
jgi:amino acid adenylation domain-containing protein